MAQGGQVVDIKYDVGAQRFFVADDDDVPGGTIVQAKTDPLTGKIRFLAGESALILQPGDTDLSAAVGDKGYSVGSTGRSKEEFLADPIAVLNEVLDYMYAQTKGGTLYLPDYDWTVTIGDRYENGYPARIFLPAHAGAKYRIVGAPGRKIFIDSSLVSAAQPNTNGWKLFTVGDRATNRFDWAFTDLPDGVTDAGGRNFDMLYMCDYVEFLNLDFIGDEPEPVVGLTPFTNYQYQWGFIAATGSKVAVIKNCKGKNSLNTAFLASFVGAAYFINCEVDGVGMRKSSGQPANAFDMVGLGANVVPKTYSTCLYFACRTHRIHDVSYMSVWADTTAINCDSDFSAIYFEHQAHSFATEIEDLAGNITIIGGSHNGDVSSWSSTPLDKEFDAIILNGGSKKVHKISGVRLRNVPNMAVSTYGDHQVTLEDLYLYNCGINAYTEFPLIYHQAGSLQIDGGRFVNVNKGLVQLGTNANLIWGDRTVVVNPDRSLYYGNGNLMSRDEYKLQIQGPAYLNIADSDGRTLFAGNIDLAVRGSTTDRILSLWSWSGATPCVIGKFRLDYDAASVAAAPIEISVPNSTAVFSVDITGYRPRSPNSRSGANTYSWGWATESALLKVNDQLLPTKGTAIYADFRRDNYYSSVSAASDNSVLNGMASRSRSTRGVFLDEAGAVGAVKTSGSAFPVSASDFLSTSAGAHAGWQAAEGFFLYLETEAAVPSGGEDASVLTIKSFGTASPVLSVAYVYSSGEDSIVAALDNLTITLPADRLTVNGIVLAFNATTKTLYLGCNGYSESLYVGDAFPDMETARVFLGVGAGAFASSFGDYAPKPLSGYVRNVVVANRTYDQNLISAFSAEPRR